MPEQTTTYRPTWQLWAQVRRIVGDVSLEKVFKVGRRQIERWSADPAYAESAQQNPDDRRRWVLNRLMELGRQDVARDMVTAEAFIVGCELRCIDDVEPDKADLRDELLDDMRPCADYQDTARAFAAGERTLDELMQAQEAVFAELRETTAVAIRERSNA